MCAQLNLLVLNTIAAMHKLRQLLIHKVAGRRRDRFFVSTCNITFIVNDNIKVRQGHFLCS